MITVHTFASGSSGNAALISHGNTHLLLDAGIACRRITQSLEALSLTPADLDGVLITHIHSDHVSALEVLSKRLSCPLYARAETCSSLARRGYPLDFRPLDCGEAVTVGSLTVRAVRTSHDVRGGCGWRIDAEDGAVGFLTDTGVVTDEARELLPGVSLMFLESNHDLDKLHGGFYPEDLKARIEGPYGHLCNEDAARFAVTLAEHGAREFVLCHLSEENNTPELALAAFRAAFEDAGTDAAVSVAPRSEVSRAYVAEEGVLCRR
ncbi:MAG: MBL fold metallo-hydrolase [Oscillibacter sp.]|nr:MBL fold metallo-hydrolase [Oscillibacter sp.]